MNVLFPAQPDELWSLWRTNPDALLMAGGTDLLVKIANRKARPETVLCLEKIGVLREIRRDEGAVSIGAAATHQSLLDHPLIREEFSILWKALSLLGSPPIRHAGTIGGNVCTASPAGDTIPALYVLDADVELWSTAGIRRMPVSEFILGPGRTALHPGEIAGRVIIPLQWARAHNGFFKIGHRKALAIAVASLAAVWQTDDAGNVSRIKLAWGSVGPKVMMLTEVETRLTGQPLTDDILLEAKETVVRRLAPIDDIRATAEYRKQAAGNLLLKLLD